MEFQSSRSFLFHPNFSIRLLGMCAWLSIYLNISPIPSQKLMKGLQMWKILMSPDTGFRPNRLWEFLFLYYWADAFVRSSILRHSLGTKVKYRHFGCFPYTGLDPNGLQISQILGSSVSRLSVHFVAFEWRSERSPNVSGFDLGFDPKGA